MATKLKDFDFSAPSVLTTSDKAVYDWNDWFDGDIWELTQGEDFMGHPLMMERIIRTRATSRKAKIQLRHVGVNGDQFGKLIIQRVDIIGPMAEKRQARKEKTAATRAANKAASTQARKDHAVSMAASSKQRSKKVS